MSKKRHIVYYISWINNLDPSAPQREHRYYKTLGEAQWMAEAVDNPTMRKYEIERPKRTEEIISLLNQVNFADNIIDLNPRTGKPFDGEEKG